jgi:hypothetical protein
MKASVIMTTDLSVDREMVLAALRQVYYPGRSRDIVSFGLVPHAAAFERLAQAVLDATPQPAGVAKASGALNNWS